MTIRALAQHQSLYPVALGLLMAGSAFLMSPTVGLAQSSSAVPAAEAAARILLPRDAKIVGSRRLGPNQAEVLVDVQGQVSPLIMAESQPGQWQQDLQATLNRTASELQASLQTAELTTAPVPAIGQAEGETLIESTRGASVLIEPISKEEATERALSRSGRQNPFEPLNQVIEAAPISNNPPTLPPPIPIAPPVSNPISADAIAPTPAVAQIATPEPIIVEVTPTPDPAAFAKTVEVSGVIQIDNESYALVSAQGNLPAVVQSGENYSTATIQSVAARGPEVILVEGGEQVIKTVETAEAVPEDEDEAN